MKLSISGYSNPMKSFERSMAPDTAAREFRDPGLRGLQSGLGSLHTMPHLRPGARMQAGGSLDLGHIIAGLQQYAGTKPNLYNPDPTARRTLLGERQMAGQYSNPAFRAMPGATAGFAAAEGGELEDPAAAASPADLMEGDDSLSPQQQQEKQIVVEAMLALEGRHPDPKRALDAFKQAFGPDALQELKQMMANRPKDEEQEEQGDEGGESEQPPAEEDEAPAAGPPEEEDEAPPAGAGGGLLRGPGSGQSDEIEGSTPSGRPVLLSDGEYVVDAPTVSALGDGSTHAGARRLDELRKKIRTSAYGHPKQAKPMKNGGHAIMVEFGG
jgi:hypothetical protein